MTSAVVLTRNEEKNIERCLKSLSFCDEIILVDDNSIDQTPKLAKKFGAKVYLRDMGKDYSSQSNFGMEKATNKWVLFVDADEVVTDKLRSEILEITSQERGVAGYYIKREDTIWGRKIKYGEAGNVRLLRLVKKGSGKWTRRVHPNFEIRGKTSSLNNILYHYPHRSVSQFIESVNRWSTWHAMANKEEGKTSSLFKIIFMPVGHFVKNFIFRLGFLDGIYGFVFAIIMSFHSFLAWGKLLLLQKKEL